MTIIDLISIVSDSAGGVDVIRKHFTNSTPEDLFKKSFVDAVKQVASSLAHVADPKTIKADKNRLDQVLASLKDSDLTELVLLNKDEKLLKVTELFQECINLPGHQLTPEQLVQRLQPVIERTITNFYERLPRNQQATNQIMLEIEPQESFSEFPKRFPDDEGLWSIKLNDFSDNVPKATDSTSIQPILEFTDKQHEALLQIKNVYKEHLPPIGTFMGWTGRNALDVWNFLIDKPDLGIRCYLGSAEERAQALALLDDPKPKLVVDLISLITLHCLEAADTVVKVFGKLCIAQSTIDELLQIIYEKEGMWSQREGMSIEKQGNRHVRHMINPEDVRRDVGRLKDLIKWIRKNCEVLPCPAMLDLNLFQKQKLDDMLQPLFIDTLLIASQPGYLLLSDDGPLRTYAKTNFNSDTGTNFQIEGVWTQIVLEHCLNQNGLDKTKYNKMVIQLVCSHYYYTAFDADVLMEALKQANWNLVEPYNSLVQALSGQRMSLKAALNVTIDFLFQLWEEPISHSQQKYLTFGLLAGLTAERPADEVLGQLASRIQKRDIYSTTANHILRQIKDYSQFYPTIEGNFDFLAEDNIRIKGTRIGIETLLYEVLHLSKIPEEIVQSFDLLTWKQVYATILYYLQNPIKIGGYLADNLQYSKILREEYEKNPPPGVVRLRQLKAESDDPQTPISKNKSATTASLSKTEQE